MSSSWLYRALEESRARGFLGPGEIEPHIAHSIGFANTWRNHHPTPPFSFVDLGSGGGLPSLVLLEYLECSALLIDSMQKRCTFLREALEWDGAPTGGDVIHGRVEEIAREDGVTEAFDLVTARSFGPPAVVAECASRFLKIGGLLIVSEPPDDGSESRWSEKGLATLGLRSLGRERHGSAFQVIEKTRPTPPAYPRPTGVPGKSPLF